MHFFSFVPYGLLLRFLAIINNFSLYDLSCFNIIYLVKRSYFLSILSFPRIRNKFSKKMYSYCPLCLHAYNV